ncbi:hypothetical protein JBL43_17395 [Aureibaculum sp. A20]|uniref:Uncharacterized protein n=1 Tax=Aureibaculum flavum TaxID=2795986 RepID=A0ABS0WVP8_9FLAO|nr:hypothetical protein [Aureibaculum flavum]MBJ2176032.1 hypothetical protein [Aureibaculum flavum]
MLSYMPTITEDAISNRFSAIKFLVGSYSIDVFSYIHAKGWVKSGEGNSEFVIEDTFITEKVKLNKENYVINLTNTIGSDECDKAFRLLSLDIPVGSIEIYKGEFDNESLVFTNLESETKVKDKVGEEVSFKLIYKPLSENENELIVGYTKNNGKTWRPYVKNIYRRK